MRLTCYGAAQEVTGSKHLLEVNGQRILLDCGMFQGRRRETHEKNADCGFDPKTLDAAVLSHAHVDHSGLLPLLHKQGYNGRIYATPATRDLCTIMLLDSAHIQQKDVEWLAKKRRSYVEPLYDQRDVHRVLRRFISVPYEERVEIARGVYLTFHDAGHVLGSAMIELQCEENGQSKTFLFSGDIGRPEVPLLPDPWTPGNADFVLMESTYGNRDHEDFATLEDQLLEIVIETRQRGGKVIIPSFALERAQEIIYTLKRLQAEDRLDPIPVYVDSPMTVNITDVYRLHTDSFDEDVSEFIEQEGDPFHLDHIHYIREVAESMKLNTLKKPAIIISASGMCESGRILHHLKNNCEDPRNTILIVGFQAQHTLGRRIVERRPKIRILGDEYRLEASVKVLNAFSGHAGRKELIEFGARFAESAQGLFLVHGELESMQALQAALKERGINPQIPQRGVPIDL